MEKLAFTISLADLVTGPAKRMQKSLLDEAAALNETRGKLLEQSKAMLEANSGAATLEKSISSLEKALKRSAALGDVRAYQKQSRDLGMLRAELAQTDTSGLRLSETLRGQADAAGKSSKSILAQAEASEVGAASMAAYASAAAVAVGIVLKLVKATAELVLQGAEFTLTAVAEKRAAQEMFRAMAGGEAAGDQLFAMMEDLATQLPQTKDQLTAWSREFTAMGILKQDELRTELRATASAAALMGESGVDAFTTLTRKITEAAATSGKLKLADKQLAGLAATGANVSDIAKILGVSAKHLSEELRKGTVDATAFGAALNTALITKGRGPLERMFGDLDVLRAKFKEAIGDMFEDVDVSPFVEQVKGLLGVFEQAQPSGQVMKAAVGGFFKQFFQWAAIAVVTAKHMFLQLIIWALKAYIALKPYGAEIKLFVKGLLITAAVITGVVLIALGLLAGALALIVAPMVLGAMLALKLYEAWESWGGISGIVSAAFDAVTSTLAGWIDSLFDFEDRILAWGADAASNLVAGLVNGIENGVGQIRDAVWNMAKSALSVWDKVTGTHSPSREMIKRGGFLGAGLVQGVTAANDNARAATEGLADAALSGASRGAMRAPSAGDDAASDSASASGKSSGGIVVNIAPGAIVIQGASGDVSELTEHAVSLIFEKIALAQGAA